MVHPRRNLDETGKASPLAVARQFVIFTEAMLTIQIPPLNPRFLTSPHRRSHASWRPLFWTPTSPISPLTM